ncbi:MAG TPA: hypothetical protein VLT36_23905 [Candidatus Dormibacteraeota bacterium]|nr:hypothetical protein [Candidatus Dormibacteraeota bacterium]
MGINARDMVRLLLLGVIVAGAGASHAALPTSPAAPGLKGTRATYCSAPRKPDGHINVDRLVTELVDVGANTYSFCIHVSSNDWQDFKLFLPAARAKGIKVWGSVVPPSESPPRTKMYAEPFQLDYQRWAVEFAKLSVIESNLVAWSIDDFTHNLKFYTPEYVKQMQDAAHRINPKLAFVPCCYYPALNAQFATNYAALLDGVLFPYRHESAGANLKDPSLVEAELKTIRERMGTNLPIILDIYASAHSRLGATTAEYVKTAVEAGLKAADGVMIYRHQDRQKDAEKFQIVRTLFQAKSRD